MQNVVSGWLNARGDLAQCSWRSEPQVDQYSWRFTGRPLVDTVKASRHKNMKELRPGSKGRSELRILFAFDFERNAVLLIAGDKSCNWKKWYEVNIPVADSRFDEHARTLKGER